MGAIRRFALVPYAPPLIQEAILEKTDVADLVPSWSVPSGDAASRNTVVDIADLQCPYCKEAYWDLKKLSRSLHFRLVLLHFPLPFHKQAELASRLAMMLARRGKFWAYVEACYSPTALLANDEDYKRAARALGLSESEMRTDLAEKDQSYSQVHRDMEVVAKLRPAGVPTLILLRPNELPRYVAEAELPQLLRG